MRCDIKRRYSNRKFAAMIAARRGRVIGERLNAYHCTAHHCWHIGHVPTWRTA